MAYYKEIKKIRRITEEIKSGEVPNVSISQTGTFLVSLISLTSVTAECSIGWDNERISRIIIKRDEELDAMLSNGFNEKDVVTIIQKELSPVFSNQKVKLPPFELT